MSTSSTESEVPSWIIRREGRQGVVMSGEHVGANAFVFPEPRDPDAWHIELVTSAGEFWDTYADDVEQLLEWLGPTQYAIRFKDED